MFKYDISSKTYLIVILSISIILSIVFYFTLKNKGDKEKRIPLYIIALILTVLEIFKQVKNAIGYDYRIFFSFITKVYKEFDFYALPFHFCSFFIVWIILQFLFRNSKHSITFDNLSYLWSLAITIGIIVNPSLIFGDRLSLLYYKGILSHTVVFHSFVVIYFFISTMLRTYDFKIKEIYKVYLPLGIYAIIAVTTAHLFKTNYCSLYDIEGWEFARPLFEKGYFLYDSCVIFVGFIIISLLYLIVLLIEKIRGKKYERL